MKIGIYRFGLSVFDDAKRSLLAAVYKTLKHKTCEMYYLEINQTIRGANIELLFECNQYPTH